MSDLPLSCIQFDEFERSDIITSGENNDDGMIYNALLVIIKESCVTNAFLDPTTIGLTNRSNNSRLNPTAYCHRKGKSSTYDAVVIGVQFSLFPPKTTLTFRPPFFSSLFLVVCYPPLYFKCSL